MTQGELEKLPLKLEQIFSELETRIMSDVVRRIKENGFSTASADWQITRLAQLEESEENIKKWVQEALEASDQEIEAIFSDEVYKQYYGHERAYRINGMEMIPYKDNLPLQQLISATKRQIEGEYENMAASMGFAIRDASGKIIPSPLMDFYRSTLDNAVIDIQSGAFSYQTVLERTINRMTSSGIRWIDYDSGVHSRVSVAARRAVMTGFRQVQGYINEQTARDLGTDTYEVTWHVGARPTHQVWQGRVYTMAQLQSICGLGDVTGLHGANCYHDYNPFIPGVSVRTYTDEWLDEQNRQENAPKSYNGKEYTTYQALQRQRKMESAMRKSREDIRLMQEGRASEESIILKKAKYQGQMQAYRDFSDQMGLPQQLSRVYQDGLTGKFLPTKSEISKLYITESGKKAEIKWIYSNTAQAGREQLLKDRMFATEEMVKQPVKVRNAISDVIVSIGNAGGACDYINGIIYLGEGIQKGEVSHEVGHLVEHRMMNRTDVEDYKKFLTAGLTKDDIYTETYYNDIGEPVDVFLIRGSRFVSEYQSRLYVDSPEEAVNADGSIKFDKMLEVISEPYRMYMMGEKIPENIKKLIEKVVL